MKDRILLVLAGIVCAIGAWFLNWLQGDYKVYVSSAFLALAIYLLVRDGRKKHRDKK